MVLIANFYDESEQVWDIWETMVVKLLLSLRRVQLPAVPWLLLFTVCKFELYLPDRKSWDLFVEDLSVWNV